ncbi:MAG TPA: glycosyltransferase, partial [Candidatus Saccharimonadales bacterium]|nr:glycosyltransferase [Candidatus Saccharimonadales bacterium]
MKKLLILGTGSYKGTLSIRLRDLARHLGKDFDVTAMTPPADKYNDFKPDYSIKPEGYNLVQPWQLATRSPIINLVPYLFTSLFHILKSRADIVYIYKPTPITILGLVPRLWGRRIVMDMDDLGSEVMQLEGQSGLNVKLVALSERLAMRFAHQIVVTSTLLESEVKAQYPRKPILVLPNGVEPSDYAKVTEKPLRNAAYFFGGINRLDIVEDLLRAIPVVVKQVPDAHFTIAGGGSALGDAKKLVSKLGVKKSVTFTGWLTDMHAIQQHTQFGDIGICYQPDGRTNRAASNMKVFQYMAMGTVPVVSNVGDLRTYVRSGKAGVVVAPGDSTKLAEAITALLLD